jgi:uncharacterized integral membrane protein
MGIVLGVLAAILLASGAATFALLNQTPVQLNFGIGPLQPARIHEIALASAAAGALISGFPLLGALWRSYRALRASRRQVRALEERLKSLGETPGPALYSGNSSALAPVHTTKVARADEEPV